MKLLFDFLPLILFFGTFKVAEGQAAAAARFATEHMGFVVSGGVVGPDEAPVLLATVVVVVATLLQIGFLLLTRRKVHAMLWVTFGIVAVLGAATVWFHNPTFIKWKPSVLYWGTAFVFWASQTLFSKNLVRSVLDDQFQLPAPVWQRLNLAWIAFFASIGVVNLYVAYNFSTSTWASFKVFGITGVMLIFLLAQGLYLARHVKEDDEALPVEREPG